MWYVFLKYATQSHRHIALYGRKADRSNRYFVCCVRHSHLLLCLHTLFQSFWNFQAALGRHLSVKLRNYHFSNMKLAYIISCKRFTFVQLVCMRLNFFSLIRSLQTTTFNAIRHHKFTSAHSPAYQHRVHTAQCTHMRLQRMHSKHTYSVGTLRHWILFIIIFPGAGLSDTNSCCQPNVNENSYVCSIERETDTTEKPIWWIETFVFDKSRRSTVCFYFFIFRENF